MSFPSGTWNKRQALGSENGIIQNPTHIVDMLVSIGYRREDILEKILDPLKWDIGMR